MPPVAGLRLVVEDRVGAHPAGGDQLRPGRRVEQFDRRYVAARAAEQQVQVVQALGVGQVHHDAVVRELPDRPVAPKLVPLAGWRNRRGLTRRDDLAGGGGLLGRVGVGRFGEPVQHLRHSEGRCLLGGGGAQRGQRRGVARVAPAGEGVREAGAGEQRPGSGAQPIGGVTGGREAGDGVVPALLGGVDQCQPVVDRTADVAAEEADHPFATVRGQRGPRGVAALRIGRRGGGLRA